MRVQIGVMQPQTKNVQILEAGRGKDRCSPRISKESEALLTPWFQPREPD